MSLLQTELLNLVAQNKKRNGEIKQSAEKSLAYLEALDSLADLSALRAHPEFSTPFLLACTSSNAKSCASALQCLQVLISLHGLAASRLEDVLNALFEAIHLGVAIQLKVLQLLPLLLSEHFDELKGDLLSKQLQVCVELGRDQKATMVSNTAYATLQQLITSLFDNIKTSDGDNTLEINSKVYHVNNTVYDAGRILVDLCDLAERQPPHFLRVKQLPIAFTLELFELTLTNHADVFAQPVFKALLSQRIVPLLLRMFSEATNEFPFVVRVARLFYLLVRKHLSVITVEAEVILNTLAQNCKNSSSLWKQILCLEVYQGVLSDTSLVLEIFTQYRRNSSSTLQDAIECFSAALVKSNVPMAVEDPTTTAIAKSLNPKVPCIDLLDKTEAPEFNKSYFYYLIMVCINSISDGISKLSAATRNSPGDGAKVVELLEQIDVPLTNCFAALVGGSMDLDLFKVLVKSVQRGAHACGIHGLAQQRDNYIRILVQHSWLPEDAEVRSRLLQRSIFCVRALFNLGYALGNKLTTSWSLLVDCVDTLSVQISPEGFEPVSKLFGGGDEYAPIELSLKRMLDQTADLEDEAIVYITDALLAKPVMLNFSLCQYLIQTNADRYFRSEFWDSFSTKMLAHVANDKLNISVRLSAMRALDASVLITMNMAEQDDAFKRILDTLHKQIQLPQHEIQLSAVSTLNSLLDQFSSKFTSGWEQVLEIIAHVSRTETQPELYKTTFKALELICRDFLENLPHSCVYDLTQCLDQFSRQHLDLNTSFTATSLFWPVCDYIIKEANTHDKADDWTGFGGDLEALARGDSPHKQYALWLSTQIKLAHIANDPQHQIKTGAIHIFFRLFDAHYARLPDPVWQQCLELVFPEIMKVEGGDENPQETFTLIVNGIGSIYTRNIRRSADHLSPVLEFFKRCGETSMGATLAQLSTLIDAIGTQASPDIKGNVWQFWVSQNPSPEPRGKSTTDALVTLVEMLEKVDKFVDPTPTQIAQALELLVRIAQFQNARTGLSELQQVVLNGFECIWQKPPDSGNVEQVIGRLSELCVYCFKEDVPTAHYSALSLEAQTLLLRFLQEFKALGRTMDGLDILDSTVTVLERSSERSCAVQIFLLLMDGLANVEAQAPALTKGGVSIVGGGVAGDSFCEAIDKFIAILERAKTELIWPEFIQAVAINSLLYERGYYMNERLFECEIPAEVYGTIEAEAPAPRPQMAYHCLGILQQQPRAAALYHKRVEIVLKQTVGDAKLRGREPMSELLESELLFILGQLEARRDASLDRLLLRCISINDPRVRQTIERILT